MTNSSADQEMESTDTFCLMSPDGYHIESYEVASVWEKHSYHQRRADLLSYLAAELGFENSHRFRIDDIERLHHSLNELLEPAHERHQLLHERYVREGKPPAACGDECALTYIDGQPIPTEDDLTFDSFEGLSRDDHEKVFQERVLSVGHRRLQDAERRIEDLEKIWDAYLRELRSWHEEGEGPNEIDVDDLPF